jgi:phosphoglycolate phosphatase
MSLPFSAAIFDMDGTLLDTLDDLADATNATLSAYGFPVRTREEVRLFVGNGVEKLMERALPGGHAAVAHLPDGSCADFDAMLSDFKRRYAARCRSRTRPYPGIPALLTDLRRAGIPVAVVSNKFDAAVRSLSDAYFGDLIGVAVGERDGVRKKPAPDTVFEALRLLGVPAGGSPSPVYIGDSDVDIATAAAAGLPCISVTWGFRSRAFLAEHGASRFAASADELKAMLLGTAQNRP